MSNLQDRLDKLNEGVLFNLQIGFWGARAKLDKSKLGRNVPKKIVRAMQDLVDDKTLIDDIRTVQRQIKYEVKTDSMPFPIDSVFFVPKSKLVKLCRSVDEKIALVDERAKTLSKNFKRMERKFARKYPDYYDPKKYPRNIADRFYARYTIFQIGLPDNATNVLDPKEYQREVNKFRGMIDEMENMAMNLIANKLMERIDKLAGQCSNGDDLHGKTVGSINRFIDKWDDLWSGNVDNAKLNRIMLTLKRNMKKVSIDRLRGNEHFRQEIGTKMEGIMNRLEKLPNIELKRKIDI